MLTWAFVSYLFVAYLFDKRRFSTKPILDVWNEAEPAFAGEQLVRAAVSPRVEAVFYLSGNFPTKAGAFSQACEVFQLDEYAEAPAQALRAAGEKTFQYAAWMSSDMFDYDVTMLFSGDNFEGRAIIDGQGERVSVQKGHVSEYARETIALSPRDLGLVDDTSGHFDEEAFQRALTEHEEPFRPSILVRDELGVTRGKVIDALHNVWNNKGEVLWPSGGAQDTHSLRTALQNARSASMFGLPMWEYLRDESRAAEKAKASTRKGRKAK